MPLSTGDTAPDFALPDQDGTVHRLKDYADKTVVLYFYPKDDTPGCTAQACSFRDSFQHFRDRDTVILGVSPDDPESHQRFARKYELPFPLLADTDHSVAEAYGVWTEKNNYGRKYMGVERSTFVIGPDGKIRQAFRKVKVEGHHEEVLQAL